MWRKRVKLRPERWRATASAGRAAASAARKMDRAWRRRVRVVIAETLDFGECGSTQRPRDAEEAQRTHWGMGRGAAENAEERSPGFARIGRRKRLPHQGSPSCGGGFGGMERGGGEYCCRSEEHK